VKSRRADGPYVLVSGPPGSGKTTLAGRLAPALGLPLLAKDTIKQALLSVLPSPDVETSRALGRASASALLAVASEARCGVLDSVWHRAAVDQLRLLPGTVVEVFCRCGRIVAQERQRGRSGTRDPGHFDFQRPDSELWNDEVATPVDGGWPVIQVDTSGHVDVDQLAARLRTMMQGSLIDPR